MLRFTCASVSFVYTFSLSAWSSQVPINGELSWFTFPDFLRSSLLKALQGEYDKIGYSVNPGTPPDRLGVLPFLAFDDSRKMVAISGRPSKATLKGALRNYPVTVRPLIRLSNSGVGTCTFEVSFEVTKSTKIHLNERVVTEFFRLTRNLWDKVEDPVSMLVFDGKETTLFNLFLNEMDLLCKQVRCVGYHVRWNEKDFKHPDSDRPFVREQDFSYGTAVIPFLVTMLGVSERTFSRIGQDYVSEQTKNLHAELAALLHTVSRPDWGWDKDRLRRQIEQTFLQSTGSASNGILKNLNLFKLPFIALGNRSCVLIGLNRLNGASEKIMASSTLDCVELLRMQWHFYITSNAVLDDELANLVHFSDENPPRKEKYLTDALARVIRLREKLAMILDDLETFRWGGNAIALLCSEGERHFELNELRSTVLKKNQVLKDLYDDIQELQRQKKYHLISDELTGNTKRRHTI